MRVGVQFSTLVTGVLSLLLVITGTAVSDIVQLEHAGSGGGGGAAVPFVFHIEDLTHTLRQLINPTAEAFFVGGLVAASMSSALTVAMGAALACQSLLSGGDTALVLATKAAAEHERSGGGGGGDGGSPASSTQTAPPLPELGRGGDDGGEVSAAVEASISEATRTSVRLVATAEAQTVARLLRQHGWGYVGGSSSDGGSDGSGGEPLAQQQQQPAPAQVMMAMLMMTMMMIVMIMMVMFTAW